MNPAHRVGRARTQLSFIMVREKLGLVRRHVHLHRTLALTSLARKTQVERFFNRLAPPAVCNRFTPNHLAEQTRPAARGMLFLECDHVAGTHCSAALRRQTPAPTQRSVAWAKLCLSSGY